MFGIKRPIAESSEPQGDRKYDRIMALLKEKGENGAFNYELNRIAFRYSAIIHTMRKDGWNITTERVKQGVYKFTLHED